MAVLKRFYFKWGVIIRLIANLIKLLLEEASILWLVFFHHYLYKYLWLNILVRKFRLLNMKSGGALFVLLQNIVDVNAFNVEWLNKTSASALFYPFSVGHIVPPLAIEYYQVAVILYYLANTMLFTIFVLPLVFQIIIINIHSFSWLLALHKSAPISASWLF